ncbi:kinetochore complex Sim4 subunit Fta1-domain-containing protein [Aspergillus desertorum]
MASPHHLLNTSWTSHRLSPLHYEITQTSGPESLLTNKTALDTYAARLRDHLTNSLAVGGAPTLQHNPATSTTLGALQSCTWEAISSLSFLDPNPVIQDGDEVAVEQNQEEPAGLLITLIYENATYKTALLGPGSDLSRSQSQNQEQKQTQTQRKRKKGRPSLKSSITTVSASAHLPLLLTRLPKPLKESFISFLSLNFDTYVSEMRISSQGLCGVLESYLSGLTPAGAMNVGVDVEDIIREIHLTLAFAPPIAPSLKALVVNIPRETMGGFIRAPSSTSYAGTGGSSVLSGLSAYLSKHLAMELRLPLPEGEAAAATGPSLAGGYVRLTRIACAGFVVTAEGRLKIVAKADDRAGGGREDDERNSGALRGGEALLRAVLERAGNSMGSEFEGHAEEWD